MKLSQSHQGFAGQFLSWRFVLCAAAFMSCGLARSAQAHTVEASAQPFGYQCLLNNDSGPGLRTTYVRLGFNSGATGARFKLVLSPGATMSYVSESTPFMFAGNTQTGIAICFGSCLEGGQVQVMATVRYMSYGTDERCSELRVVPYPGAETVEVMECDGTAVAATVADLQLLPYSPPFAIPCPCSGYHQFSGVPQQFDCQPVSTENTTWGRVKALYKNE